jgi:hypothetical protein
MNPEIKAKWADRLINGSDAQGTGYLHRIDGHGVSRFCCLGILCELTVEAGIAKKRLEEPSYIQYTGIDVEWDIDPHAQEISVLPPAVAAWAGCDPNPFIQLNSLDGGTDHKKTASFFNDGVGKTLTEIGALILADETL